MGRTLPDGHRFSYPIHVHPLPTQATPHNLIAYERGPPTAQDVLIYISGLTSGPHTTEVSDWLHCESMGSERYDLNYAFWELRMRSSYGGWGYGSLKEDVEDLAALVGWLRGGSGGAVVRRIVMLGSSSGCQAIMTYALTPSLPQVDAYVLQAPTSDRETATLLMTPDLIAQSLDYAISFLEKGESKAILPSYLLPAIFTTPVTAYRWHSLLSPGGDDDFFSSDLSLSTLQSTFGRLDKPTLIVMSENDKMVPNTVDKKALLERWVECIPEPLRGNRGQYISRHLEGGVLAEADHELTTDRGRREFADCVVRFLMGLEGRGETIKRERKSREEVERV